MKLFHLLLVLLLSISVAQADTALSRSNGLLRFLASQAGVRNFALLNVIGNRCDRYMPFPYSSHCRAAVKEMIKVLDFDIILSHDQKYLMPSLTNEGWKPSSFVFVAFKQNFIALLAQPKTAVYLNDLNQQLYQVLLGQRSHLSVWDLTRAHYKNDYLTALVIASLFQDTSMMKLHLAYLEKAQTRGNQQFQDNKELLGRVIDTVNLLLDRDEDFFRELFYPKEVARNLNRNIYHFYVPLFLSMSLKKKGVPTELAYSAALMLTLSYEFVTAGSDYRYLFDDPESINPDSVAGLWKIKDIFGGYCGSNFGVRGMSFRTDFENIKEAFARSSEDGVRLLLRH